MTSKILARACVARAVTFSLSLTPSVMHAQSADWASLGRYQGANRELGPPQPGEDRVVFYGDSITDAWAASFETTFPAKPYVGRGISGQTTPQMLVRFRQDVIALDPAVVVILAGTNDIAGNTGPSTQAMIEDNLVSMVELAKANGIQVVLASVLPASNYRWRPGVEPGPKIVALNTWMEEYAAANGLVYLDYHSAMTDEHQGLGPELSQDGVHPQPSRLRTDGTNGPERDQRGDAPTMTRLPPGLAAAWASSWISVGCRGDEAG